MSNNRVDTTFPWHQGLQKLLLHALRNDQLAHALLFNGALKYGHLEFVHQQCQMLLCDCAFDVDVALPCGHCASCQALAADAHPDFRQVSVEESKKQISIEQIRQVNEFLKLSSSLSRHRVVFIQEAERMNHFAANALLKSLEEPPENAYLVLHTTQLSKILPTLRSRCRLMHLPNPNQEEAKSWLSLKKVDQINLRLRLSQNDPIWAENLDIDAEKETISLIHSYIQSALTQSDCIPNVAIKLEKIGNEVVCSHVLRSVSYSIKKFYLGIELNSLPIVWVRSFSIHALWEAYRRLNHMLALMETPVNRVLFMENALAILIECQERSLQ